jgi:hypothetical protein
MSQHIVTIDRWYNPTYRSEIEILYTEWCESHCMGTFDVVSPNQVTFSFINDADNFAKVFDYPWKE